MKDDHVAVLLERIEDKLARFAEAMSDVPSKVNAIERRLDHIESDMKVIKAVSIEHDREIKENDRRITILENC
jgi:hypothetical protein